ncbi:MAG: porin [Gammaproteobacteria bacterium]|nr:porin [Gammaproteobacteria bacterium]
MKKIILSAAIAAICAAPVAAIAADNNLYGQMRYSFNTVDDVTGSGQDGMSGNDNVSLFGLKGTAGDDGGTQAFYHLQTGAPTDKNATGSAFNQRFYFAGLKGGWGKAAYGRMTNAYKFDGFKLDPFYNLSHVSAGGSFSTGGASYGLSPATNGFTDNALQYTSPAFAGIKVNAGLYVDDSNEDDHGTNIGASWAGAGFNVGVQLASNADTATIPGVSADGDAVRLHGGFKTKVFSVGLSYETVDEGTVANADASTDYLYLVGRFNVTPKTELVATVGTVSPDDGAANAAAEGTGFQLAAFQTIVPKTQLYVSYGTASLDAAGSEDPSVISVGAIHKFGFGG